MSRIDNHKYYTQSLQRYGTRAEAVHWNSKASQYLRFDILLSMLKDVQDATVVDAGCGFADLYLYLQEKGKPPHSYTGIEIMEPMAEEARKRTGCEIIVGDVLQDALIEADYYICSGAMNILTRDETRLFIRRCFEASRRGFIFNILKGEDESLVYNYFQPEEIAAIARELGAGFQIRDDYLPRDFTVLLTKKPLPVEERL